MKRKIIYALIILIAATAVYNLFIKDGDPGRAPDYEISLEPGRRFISSILTLDKEGSIYTGVSLGYPRAEIRKYNSRGELQKNIPLRSEEGYLVARREPGGQPEVISRGIDYQGWQGILEVNEKGELILFDPATGEIFLLNPEGILEEEFVLEAEQEEWGSFSVQRHSMLNDKLHLGLADTRPETAGNSLQTLVVNITEQTTARSAVPVGYTDHQREEIYYTSRHPEPGLLGSTKIMLNIYDYRADHHSAEHELPLSWSTDEWRRDLWAFNPAEQALYYMDWKNWLGRQAGTFHIKRYCLETKESTTWASIDQNKANINTLALKIKQGVLYLIMDSTLYLYDI